MSPDFRFFEAALRIFKDYTFKLVYCDKLEFKSENKINYPNFLSGIILDYLTWKNIEMLSLTLNSVTHRGFDDDNNDDNCNWRDK